MSNNNELDEILNSIKKRREESDNIPNDESKSDFVPLPKPMTIESEDENDKELAPPMPSVSKEDNNTPTDLKKNINESQLVWFEPDSKKKHKGKKAKKNISDAFKNAPKKIKNNFKNSFVPKAKKVAKKIFTKQVLIIAGAIVLIVAVAFGGVKLYEYSKVAYLKPYEEKYNIEYPQGILEQFCDAYGKNQNIAGALSIEDTSTNKYVVSKYSVEAPYLEKGADITEAQQNIAISLKSSDADLEKVYATTQGFLNSTQTVVFNTLFEKSTYRVVAAFYTNTKAEDDSGYIFPYNLCGTMTQESFDQYQDRIKSRRLYDTGYEITNEDTFLTLSTDSNFMDNFRFVVLCVKADSKKSFEKSTVAIVNEKTHYPQVWYDQNNQINPYRFAAKWYPELYTDIENKKTTKLSIEDFE